MQYLCPRAYCGGTLMYDRIEEHFTCTRCARSFGGKPIPELDAPIEARRRRSGPDSQYAPRIRKIRTGALS